MSVDGNKEIAIYSGIAVVAVLVLAVLRLTHDQGKFKKIEESDKPQISELCLFRQTIPAGATLVLANKSPDKPLQLLSTGPLTLNFPVHKGPNIRKEGFDVVEGRLSNKNGNFEIRPSADKLLLTKDGQLFLREAVPKLSTAFGPDVNATYEVRLDIPSADLKLSEAERAAQTEKGLQIRPGTTGTLIGGENLSLVTLQPISVIVQVPEQTSILMPTRVTGQPGLSDISVEINKPGLQFDAAGANLTACAKTENGWAKAGIAEVKPGAPGSARVTLALPDDALPKLFSTFQSVPILLATIDGRYVAVGSFNAAGKVWAAVVSVLLTAVLLAPLMYYRGQRLKKDEHATPRWFSGLFLGPDGDPSLSLLQVLIWSIITLWGFFYVFIVAGNLLALTPQVMALLGFAGLGSVLARWISVSSGGSTSKGLGVKQENTGSMFWQMLSTNGQFDLLKLQLFAFTVVIALYVVARILDSAAFPELDPNTLLLMGVSQGIYVTGKLVSTSPLASAQAMSAEIDTLKETASRYQDELAGLSEAKALVEEKIKKADAGALPALQAELASKTKAVDEKAAAVSEAMRRIASLQIDMDKIFAQLGFTKLQQA